MNQVIKCYRDLPAAHRQPNHDGHCRFIHGHNWGFDITFSCDQLDSNGFVIDVGKLQMVKRILEYHFDHTLLLNEDDPLLNHLRGQLQGVLEHIPTLAVIIAVPNCGMEGLAQFVFHKVNEILMRHADYQARKVRVVKVVCLEDSKNSATFQLG